MIELRLAVRSLFNNPGFATAAIVTLGLALTRGDPAIVGQRFTAYVSDRPKEAEAFTIVGVLPANFWHVNPYTDIFAPLRARTYPYLVRLREGVTPEHAAARITALVTGRLLGSQLFGVGPRDPIALGAALAALGAAGLLAVWWPARRAAATDPAIALRIE